VQNDDRVFAAAEEENRTLELGDDLPDDVDSFALEQIERGEAVTGRSLFNARDG
jgi:hypothetical protein